jgi:hypothetical protein
MNPIARCKTCVNEQSRLYKEKIRRLEGMRKRIDYTNLPIKFCNMCKTEKLKTEFHSSKSTKTGLNVYCKKCAGIKANKRRENKDNILKLQERNLNAEKPTHKICTKCEQNLPVDSFHRNINQKYGLSLKCKKCIIKQHNVYSTENREKIRAINRKSYLTNKSKNDKNPHFIIARTTRRRIYDALKAQLTNKKCKSKELTGCSWQFLVEYLESKFLPNMSWNNYGLYGWHIDHINPCSSFSLVLEEEQRKCFHYTNLQPLWAKDNLQKSNKISFK